MPLSPNTFHEFASIVGKLKRKVKQEVREAFGALQVHSVQCGGPYHPSGVVLGIMGFYSYLQPFGRKTQKSDWPLGGATYEKNIKNSKLYKNILYHIEIMGFINISNHLAVKNKNVIGS